jgi:hypothetical protein
VTGKRLANTIAGAGYQNNALFQNIRRIGVGNRINSQLRGPFALFSGFLRAELLQDFVAGVFICVIA